MARNVTHKIEDDKLILTIDISHASLKAAPPSASGKTRLVASSGGVVPVECKAGDVTYAINVMVR